MPSKGRLSLITILLLIAAAIAGWYFFGTKPVSVSQQPTAIAVTAIAVKQTEIQQLLEAVGEARANESTTITANVSDHVKAIDFEDGDLVKKGQVLVELDNRQEQAELREAKARLADARQQYKRAASLLKKKFISEQEHDQLLAQVKSTEAQVHAIEARIADRVIRAPFTGVAGFREVSLGALVEPGTEITRLDEINPIKVDFNLPERYLAEVKAGQVIQARSVAYPGQVFPGKVVAVNPRVDPVSRAITLRALIDNASMKLKPGMFLDISLLLPGQTGMLIPETAVMQKQDKKFVYVIGPDQRVSQREITTGGRQGSAINVLSGLKPAERIVVMGAFKLAPGMQVKLEDGA